MTPRAYYNEIDPFAAEWLRNLILCGHIADGDVDTRSIEDVRPSDLNGYTQCHFFAGIGGWSYALRLAGWPDSTPVWTGSCPCQPFSSAGKGGGFADERHLWPAWFHLITQREPSVIFGEQVASKGGLAWLDLIQDDLEAAGYASWATDLCAASVGAKFKRQRLYWLGMGHSYSNKPYRKGKPDSSYSSPIFGQTEEAEQAWTGGESELVAIGTLQRFSSYAEALRVMDGIPNCVDTMRGYGNAIVPQAAAEVIRAYMEAVL